MAEPYTITHSKHGLIVRDPQGSVAVCILKHDDGRLEAIPDDEHYKPLACFKAVMRWQLTTAGRVWFDGTWACAEPEPHYLTWAAGLLFEPYQTHGDEVVFRYNPGYYLEEAA